jgi:NAD(P)H-hydrate epimerase
MNIAVGVEDQPAAAEALARAYGCVVVLKSANTIVSDGVSTIDIDTGGVVLATAGSGDVLTGIIAGCLVQFGVGCSKNLLDAAVIGVKVHARAGQLFEAVNGNTGMIATDLLDSIPEAISSLKRESNG